MDYEMSASGIPHDKFKILHAEYPVYWNEEEGDGSGFCRRRLRAPLTQLQFRVVFSELIHRFPSIERRGDARRVHTNFINGFKAMPIRLNP